MDPSLRPEATRSCRGGRLARAEDSVQIGNLLQLDIKLSFGIMNETESGTVRYSGPTMCRTNALLRASMCLIKK